MYWVAGACELGVDETADCWVVDLEFTELEAVGGVEAWARSSSEYRRFPIASSTPVIISGDPKVTNGNTMRIKQNAGWDLAFIW